MNHRVMIVLVILVLVLVLVDQVDAAGEVMAALQVSPR
jgi:hypothetical protein